MIVEFADLDMLKNTAIQRFDMGMAELSADFPSQLDLGMARLQAELEQIYRLVVLMQKHEPEMDRAAELWEKMTEICDEFGRRVSEMAQRHPASRLSYDRILDLRNAAEKRGRLHRRP
ncbi:MAG: hypothetical protein NTW03_14425 [Verrucomicrobia bacterium]|nr:hypothetical protein [Verrucomicrobiota bacterium]